ncbi:MAG: GNAT family N-acetyltransferase [Xanthomonadales bacterium]|nr:GNAT family N-acetyltransferase [Xanthomonadales bacterium]
MAYHLRPARADETDALCTLIQASMRGLSQTDYSAEQIEGALQGACSLDRQLIDDGTYFVVEDDHHRLAGCGGWSYRRTLFGGDNYAVREPESLDPACDAAKIRAFFIHPDHARRGLAQMIYQTCESEAKRHGFTRLELMSTLPGLAFYRELGFVGETQINTELPNGSSIPFVPMSKDLSN